MYPSVHRDRRVDSVDGRVQRTQGLYHEQVILFLTPEIFWRCLMDNNERTVAVNVVWAIAITLTVLFSVACRGCELNAKENIVALEQGLIPVGTNWYQKH